MIITVSGAHSGIGKTTLVERLLKQLKGWSALKVTVMKDGRCPKKRPCGVCEDRDIPFRIVSDSKTINENGKDTARMKASGARKVIWLLATPKGLKAGLNVSLGMLKNSRGVVIEGTSILKYLKPDLRLYIDAKQNTRVI